MSRIVLVPNAEGRVDTTPLLDYLANDVADVMRQLAPVDEGDMVSTVRPLKARGDRVKVSVGGMRGKVTGKPVGYAGYVEQGTSRMAAQPFMRPALFRYRSGGGRSF